MGVTKIAIDKRAREGENKGYEESWPHILLASGWLCSEEAAGCGDPGSDTESTAAAYGRTDRTLRGRQAGKQQHGDLQLPAPYHRDRFKNGTHQAGLQNSER